MDANRLHQLKKELEENGEVKVSVKNQSQFFDFIQDQDDIDIHDLRMDIEDRDVLIYFA